MGRQAARRWVVEEYWNLNLVVLLPRCCFAGYRRLRSSADGPESGRLTSPLDLECTSLACRLDVCAFGLRLTFPASLITKIYDIQVYNISRKKYVRVPQSMACGDLGFPASIFLGRHRSSITEGDTLRVIHLGDRTLPHDGSPDHSRTITQYVAGGRSVIRSPHSRSQAENDDGGAWQGIDTDISSRLPSRASRHALWVGNLAYPMCRWRQSI